MHLIYAYDGRKDRQLTSTFHWTKLMMNWIGWNLTCIAFLVRKKENRINRMCSFCQLMSLILASFLITHNIKKIEKAQ